MSAGHQSGSPSELAPAPGAAPGRTGAGVDEQRRAATLQAREHRAQAREPLDAGERAGGQRDADAAAIERAVDVVGVGAVERERAPHAEGLAERERALVVGVEQRLRLRARERLDPERAREAHERAVEAVAAHELGPARGRLGGEIDHVGPLAREEQHGQPVLVAHERKLAALGERLHERLGPEMLVDIGLHRCSALLIGTFYRFLIGFVDFSRSFICRNT